MTTILDNVLQFWPQTPTAGTIREIPNVGRDDLARLFAHLRFNRGVEVGTERGLYAETLLQTNPSLRLCCVDPWLAYRGYREHVSQSKLDGFFEEAQERLGQFGERCLLIRKPSVEAAADFSDNELDFVYLDGNHNLLHVIQDLYAWIPKVRKGGLITGHDFIRRKKGRYNAEVHVVEAVTAYTEAHHVDPWFVLGRKAVVEGETRDSARSWMWVIE